MDKQQRHDEIRERLKTAGKAYAKAQRARDTARANLDPILIEALEAGVPPGEVQELSTLSHQTVRTAARVAGIPPATRGGAR